MQRGNRRWAAGASRRPRQDPDRRRQVAAGQSPYAVVLSCIDSRVPPEVVFDAGLGDLLVVRTAAHTVDPLVTAAVQFGPQALQARLVVVLGHQRCGAVSAAAQALREQETLPGELPSIVAALEPVYTGSGGEVDVMVRAHIVRTVASLRADALLSGQAATVVGAYYSLDTGLVRRVA
ncbi:carbonic anhydrase [Nonomuraea guangzhouensis]|uniref:Carbonic anhydrase n=1 Tax=Nonomuraea guangzhouensis TaxID=1291555 RepID=A0ABW4GJX6_9ACTN